MSLTRCVDCLFSKMQDGVVECHRLPPEPRYGPAPALTPDNPGPERYIFWPQMAEDDFCGEGEPKHPVAKAEKPEKKSKGSKKKKGEPAAE